MADNSTSSNKRIARNTIFLYIRMFFVLIVSLYISRVVINNLGIQDYGIYSVVAGFVLFFSFLNVTLSSSIQRFYNYEGTKDGIEGYKKVYTTGIIIHLIISILLLIVLESFGVWYINNIMVIPEERLFAANIVYQAAVLSSLVVIMQTPYSGIVLAKEHMDFYAYVSIADILLKMIVAILIQYVSQDKLIVYALLLLLITIIDWVIYFVFFKRHFKFKIELHYDKGMMKNLLSFSGWSLAGTMIFMLKGQGVNMLLNFFFGPLINAAFGLASQVSSAMSGFSSNLMTAYRPQVVNAYACGDNDRVKYLMFSESKICFFLFLIIVYPVIFELDYLLKLWLGDAIPDKTNVFISLILIDSLICIFNAPCTQVVWAGGNIKPYQIITSLINILLLPICFIALKLGLDSPSVFYVTIGISVINQTAALLITKKNFSFKIRDYLAKVLKPCFISLILLPILPFVIRYLMSESILRVIVIVIIELLVAAPVFYYIIADEAERIYILNIINKGKKALSK